MNFACHFFLAKKFKTKSDFIHELVGGGHNKRTPPTIDSRFRKQKKIGVISFKFVFKSYFYLMIFSSGKYRFYWLYLIIFFRLETYFHFYWSEWYSVVLFARDILIVNKKLSFKNIFFILKIFKGGILNNYI